jgi:hypothetical protein
METTHGNSLYSYFHVKLAKMLLSFLFYSFFSSTKSENKRAAKVLTRGGRRR